MNLQHKKTEMELRFFVARHFVRPSECRDVEQIRFYIDELIMRMELMRANGFIPEYAYAVLAEYNAAQNRLLTSEFKNNYC